MVYMEDMYVELLLFAVIWSLLCYCIIVWLKFKLYQLKNLNIASSSVF